MKISCFYLIFIILFSSCEGNKSYNEKITGTWIIKELNYKNLNYQDSLHYNMIFFKNDSKVKIPRISIYKREISSWNIEEKNDTYFLNINSANNIFNGKYDIEFVKDSKKEILGIKLKSENLNILAYKIGQDYLIDGLNW